MNNPWLHCHHPIMESLRSSPCRSEALRKPTKRMLCAQRIFFWEVAVRHAAGHLRFSQHQSIASVLYCIASHHTTAPKDILALIHYERPTAAVTIMIFDCARPSVWALLKQALLNRCLHNNPTIELQAWSLGFGGFSALGLVYRLSLGFLNPSGLRLPSCAARG